MLIILVVDGFHTDKTFPICLSLNLSRALHHSPYPLIASAQPGKLSGWFDGAFSPCGQRETHFLKQRLTCFNV
jgi:hypothetical protein